MGFSRQEYWSELPCPPARDLPHPEIEPVSPALIGGFFTISATWEASYRHDQLFLNLQPLPLSGLLCVTQYNKGTVLGLGRLRALYPPAPSLTPYKPSLANLQGFICKLSATCQVTLKGSGSITLESTGISWRIH